MKLRSYFTHGEAKDQEWIVANRELLEGYMRDDMRSHGWLPALDIPTVLTWEYREKTGTFKFSLEHKGVIVGYKKAKKLDGILFSEGIIVGRDNDTYVAEVFNKELLPT
jgi:hypothetical protein